MFSTSRLSVCHRVKSCREIGSAIDPFRDRIVQQCAAMLCWIDFSGNFKVKRLRGCLIFMLVWKYMLVCKNNVDVSLFFLSKTWSSPDETLQFSVKCKVSVTFNVIKCLSNSIQSFTRIYWKLIKRLQFYLFQKFFICEHPLITTVYSSIFKFSFMKWTCLKFLLKMILLQNSSDNP